MNIQSNMNQTFSLIGLLASQSPAAAARREEAVKQRKLKNIQSQQAIIKEGSEKFAEELKDATKKFNEAEDVKAKTVAMYSGADIATRVNEYNEAGVRFAREAFELDPTFERFQALKAEETKQKMRAGIASNITRMAEGIAETEMARKAQGALAAEQSRVSKKFNLDSIADEPISLGGQPFGTVKDIGSEVSRKAIEEAYNRKDDENG